MSIRSVSSLVFISSLIFAQTAGSEDFEPIKLANGFICKTEIFALCTAALCDADGTFHCDVKSGFNWGLAVDGQPKCELRERLNENTVFSFFSTVHPSNSPTDNKLKVCYMGKPWANCRGAPCTLTKTGAKCRCVMQVGMPWSTVAGHCGSEEVCSGKAIFSSAPYHSELVHQFNVAFKRYPNA